MLTARIALFRIERSSEPEADNEALRERLAQIMANRQGRVVIPDDYDTASAAIRVMQGGDR